MALFSEDLINQLSDLEMNYKALARRLPEAGELLESVGRPAPKELLRDLANSAEEFEEIKREVLKLSEPIAGLPQTTELASIRDLRTFMETVSGVIEKQAAHRNNQQVACSALDRVLTITHVDGIEFVPLIQCQEKARDLRDSIAKTAWPRIHPDTDPLVRGQHVFSELVKFVSLHDTLDDEEWERLQDLVSHGLGKPLGLAASRGKLVMSTSAPPPTPVPVSVAQPATATEPEEETDPTEKMVEEEVPPASVENQSEGSHGEETSAPVEVTADPPSQMPLVTGAEAVTELDNSDVSGKPAPELDGQTDLIGETSTDQLPNAPALELSRSDTTAGTFEGALDDIRYMLVLDLIDGKGMAKILSNKIVAASNAAAGGDKKTAEGFLQAFINEVNAHTGKNITGAAPQLLLKDANNLLNQLR